MNDKFKNMRGRFSSGSSKNFSVYGGKGLSNINEKDEALKIAKNLHKKRLENIKTSIKKNNESKDDEKIPKFEEISNEELKKRIEYSQIKNKEFIEKGLNESSDLTEILNSIINDLL